MEDLADKYHSFYNFPCYQKKNPLNVNFSFLVNATCQDLCELLLSMSSELLPPFQIISYSNNFGDSKFSKFDQIYTTT